MATQTICLFNKYASLKTLVGNIMKKNSVTNLHVIFQLVFLDILGSANTTETTENVNLTPVLFSILIMRIPLMTLKRKMRIF